MKLVRPKEKLWPYRDLNDKNYWNPKIYIFLSFLPLLPPPQSPTAVHTSLMLNWLPSPHRKAPKRLTTPSASSFRTQPSLVCVYWPHYLLQQLLVARTVGHPGRAHCCSVHWLVAAVEISDLRFLLSHIRDYFPVIYKFPRPILAYKISITIK